MAMTLTVGEKGRVVLPAALRHEAGVEVGDQIVVRALGPHQILVETRAAVAARLRARFRDAGGTEDLRRARAADRVTEAAVVRRRDEAEPAAGATDQSFEDRRAAEILGALGIDESSPAATAG